MRGRVVGFEKGVYDSDFCFDRTVMVWGGSDPVDETFWFFGGGAVGRFFVGGVNESYISGRRVFFEGSGSDGEGSFHQSNGFPWGEAKIVGGVDFAEIATFDVDGLGERNGMGPHGRIF